jgi:hypothetical protein
MTCVLDALNGGLVMKVFLSWSGSTSKQVAVSLRKWLPYMIQSIDPFISSGDISKGDTWSDVLAHELSDAAYGIICVTPYNVSKPWMIFEAGAMSHYVGRSCVTPLLFDLSLTTLDHGPLAQFQATDLKDRNDFFRLITSINRAAKIERHLDEELLEDNFNIWWTRLSEDLKNIRRDPDETHTFYNWLSTFDDIRPDSPPDYCETVWFISPEIFRFVIGNGARRAIVRNLQSRSLKYRCLFPLESQFRDYETRLDDLRRESKGAFDFRAVSADLFKQLAPSDYVIFASRDRTPDVFVRAPVLDPQGDYWFKTEQTAADAFLTRFGDLWDKTAARGAVTSPIATLDARVTAAIG